MKKQSLLALSALIAVAIAPAIASAAPDLRLERLMDKTGLKYRFDDDDDARVAFDSTWGGNDVIVYINNDTASLEDLTVRDVWGVAFVSEDIPGHVILAAMQQNNELKVGAWSWFKLSGKEILKFSYAVSTDIAADELEDVIRAAAKTIDSFRKEHHESVPE